MILLLALIVALAVAVLMISTRSQAPRRAEIRVRADDATRKRSNHPRFRGK
ncbi:MAG: hypothetical protein AAGF79_01285 [Pseudomonadota bacterium]